MLLLSKFYKEKLKLQLINIKHPEKLKKTTVLHTLRHSSGGWSHSFDTVTGGNSLDSFSIPHRLHMAMVLKTVLMYIDILKIEEF